MKLRTLNHEDIDEIKDIHNKFFSTEFELPNFFDNFLSSFVVTDNNKIITAGGVRTITESVIITDKNYDIKDRRIALHEMLSASAYVASVRNYNQLHAFIQDENWERHLKRAGFRETKGKSLVLNL